MIHARKRFGQHFLHDPAVLARIVATVAPRPDEQLVEIGPGAGALTAGLLACVAHLDAVEIDRDLAATLRQRWPQALTLHEGDALRFDFSRLAAMRGARLRVVGNLPYNISTPLLFHLLAHRAALRDLTLMLQKEVVERMAAQPATPDYGRLTVMLAPWFDIAHLFDVGPGAFQPPPRVWSAVAQLTVLDQPRFAVPAGYGELVARAFAQRRKTLRNSLRGLVPGRGWETAGVDPGARPETLHPGQFAALAAAAGGERTAASA
ncbi:MAG TPA: 16S rRNA (adenine(1518)-N(6)/adenine(1519)-N(6))-dimethyltransferase RsmA [Steroidobacteraceae bacterium]|nr:16S rRNA (adenine(1518)-N(6)/adenine(1519)-N(6))-dimethyltransferase RsmA [Steroidobacteraceae bacterium]